MTTAVYERLVQQLYKQVTTALSSCKFGRVCMLVQGTFAHFLGPLSTREQNVVNPVKLGLQNVQRLYQLMQRPLDGIPIVHVAGTNGKV